MKSLSSKAFNVTLIGSHGLLVPDEIARPFLEAGQDRVGITALFGSNTIQFHGKLHRTATGIMISFGKRYQKELGVMHGDLFQLKLKTDQTKYGVELPEELQVVLDTDELALIQFEKLSPGKQRSLIYYVKRFKQSQTKIDKALIIADNLRMSIADYRELIKDRR